MHDLEKKTKIGYEDLLRELGVIEQKLLIENPPQAMSLMVLEAKIRERFQQLEFRVIQHDPTYFSDEISLGEELSLDEIKDLLPNDLPPFPNLEELELTPKKKKMGETVFMAAVLAMFTAVGVFGLATLLHLALSWLS